MHIADQLAVAERLASELGREARCEFFEFLEVLADFYLAVFVQQDG
jgi:hypothetical protein